MSDQHGKSLLERVAQLEHTVENIQRTVQLPRSTRTPCVGPVTQAAKRLVRDAILCRSESWLKIVGIGRRRRHLRKLTDERAAIIGELDRLRDRFLAAET